MLQLVNLLSNFNLYILDRQRVCYSALVLSMLFSTGEPIPLSYYGKACF